MSFYYGSSSNSSPVIVAEVANADLIEKIGGDEGLLAYWGVERDRLQALHDQAIEDGITAIEAKKTFWTRRTRTREEATKIFWNAHCYGFHSEFSYQLRHAETCFNRLKSILEIAEDTAFQHIILPEGDLRLVGGPPEN